VVPDAQLKDATYAMARQIADGPQIPIRMIKRLVYQASSWIFGRTSIWSRRTCRSPDGRPQRGRYGVQEKRPPRFEGR
jgi:enoyl-CoA hydratase/carnithine racemase